MRGSKFEFQWEQKKNGEKYLPVKKKKVHYVDFFPSFSFSSFFFSFVFVNNAFNITQILIIIFYLICSAP